MPNEFPATEEYAEGQDSPFNLSSTSENEVGQTQPTESANKQAVYSEFGELLQYEVNSYQTIGDILKGRETRERSRMQFHIYDNYANAMKLRGREPLGEDNFFTHFFGDEDTDPRGARFGEQRAFGCDKNGYLLGLEVDDVFVPTHFSPESLKGGYRLIKGLLEEEVPTAFFITPDLVETIAKMDGWKVLPFKIKAKFRGDDVEKTLVVNKWGVVPKLALHHAKESWANAKKDLATSVRKVEQFGQKVLNIFRSENKANAIDMDEELLKAIEARLQDLFDEDTY